MVGTNKVIENYKENFGLTESENNALRSFKINLNHAIHETGVAGEDRNALQKSIDDFFSHSVHDDQIAKNMEVNTNPFDPAFLYVLENYVFNHRLEKDFPIKESLREQYERPLKNLTSVDFYFKPHINPGDMPLQIALREQYEGLPTHVQDLIEEHRNIYGDEYEHHVQRSQQIYTMHIAEEVLGVEDASSKWEYYSNGGVYSNVRNETYRALEDRLQKMQETGELPKSSTTPSIDKSSYKALDNLVKSRSEDLGLTADEANNIALYYWYEKSLFWHQQGTDNKVLFDGASEQDINQIKDLAEAIALRDLTLVITDGTTPSGHSHYRPTVNGEEIRTRWDTLGSRAVLEELKMTEDFDTAFQNLDLMTVMKYASENKLTVDLENGGRFILDTKDHGEYLVSKDPEGGICYYTPLFNEAAENGAGRISANGITQDDINHAIDLVKTQTCDGNLTEYKEWLKEPDNECDTFVLKASGI